MSGRKCQVVEFGIAKLTMSFGLERWIWKFWHTLGLEALMVRGGLMEGNTIEREEKTPKSPELETWRDQEAVWLLTCMWRLVLLENRSSTEKDAPGEWEEKTR